MSLKSRLLDSIDRFKDATILVLGDIMLDQFVWGEVSRISPEAPVPVVQVERESFLLGGAANVGNNLRSLEARTILAGVAGNDAYGELLKDICQDSSIETGPIVTDPQRVTTLKTRIIARGQQVVRVDREETRPLGPSILQEITARLSKEISQCDAVIVSDYNKGVVCQEIMEHLTSRAKEKNIPVLIDPKPANVKNYKGATLITPNMKEAQELFGQPISTESDVVRCASHLSSTLGLEAVLITRGPEGMDLWQRDKGLFSIPTMAREVFDVTGAGDTVISILALGLVCGLSFCEAAYLSNLAASIVVGKVGTATVGIDELINAVKKAPELKIKPVA